MKIRAVGAPNFTKIHAVEAHFVKTLELGAPNFKKIRAVGTHFVKILALRAPNFMKIHAVGAELFHADRRMDGIQTIVQG